MLRLLVRIVNTGKAGDLAFVDQFIQAFDVALAAHFDGTADIDFHEVANFLASPLSRLAIGGNSSGAADDAIAGEQAADECDALHVGIAILAAETKTLREVGAR